MGCPFLLHIRGDVMNKDVAVRALKTFWQSAVAYLVAALSTQGVEVLEREGVLGGLLIGALAAGISASWNGVVRPRLDKLKGGDL